MLGEPLAEALLVIGGVEGDCVLALLGAETGRVATAKHPRLWRSLLQFTAASGTDGIVITLPDGRDGAVTADGVDEVLSAALGRPVHLREVRLRGILPTPRCSVPTLEHSDLPRALHAVRVPLAENRIDVPGFGVLPCAGVHAEVVTGGRIREGDVVELGA